MAPIILFIKSKFLSFAPSSPCSWPQIFPRASLCCSVPTSQAAGRVAEVETRGCQSPVSLRDPAKASQRQTKSEPVCVGISCVRSAPRARAQLSIIYVCTCIYWWSPDKISYEKTGSQIFLLLCTFKCKLEGSCKACSTISCSEGEVCVFLSEATVSNIFDFGNDLLVSALAVLIIDVIYLSSFPFSDSKSSSLQR